MLVSLANVQDPICFGHWFFLVFVMGKSELIQPGYKMEKQNQKPRYLLYCGLL